MVPSRRHSPVTLNVSKTHRITPENDVPFGQFGAQAVLGGKFLQWLWFKPPGTGGDSTHVPGSVVVVVIFIVRFIVMFLARRLASTTGDHTSVAGVVVVLVGESRTHSLTGHPKLSTIVPGATASTSNMED